MQLSSPACAVQLGVLQERKVSPPDLPPPELYKSMGQMLQQVVKGNRFRPVTVKDVAAAAAKNASKVLLLLQQQQLLTACTQGLHASWLGLSALRVALLVCYKVIGLSTLT